MTAKEKESQTRVLLRKLGFLLFGFSEEQFMKWDLQKMPM